MHFTHLSLGHTWTYIFTSLTLSHALKYFPSFLLTQSQPPTDQSKTQELWTVNIIKDYEYQANKCFKFQFFAGNWISIFKSINYAFAFKDSMPCFWNTSKVSSSKWLSISSLVDINLDCCVVWSESSVEQCSHDMWHQRHLHTTHSTPAHSSGSLGNWVAGCRGH